MADSDSEDEVLDYSVFDTDEEEDAELARAEAFLAEDDFLTKRLALRNLSTSTTSTSVPTKHQSPTLPSTEPTKHQSPTLPSTEPTKLQTPTLPSTEPTKHQSSTLPNTSTACAEDDKDALELQKIESALGLNKILGEKLKELEGVLAGRLRECRERLADIHKASREKPVRPEVFHYVNCGKPYFRDASNFPAPPNEDTIIMAKSKMFDFSEITSVPGWTANDKSSLSRLLLKMSRKIRKNKLMSEIAKIKREGKNKSPKQLKRQIAVVNREIRALKTKTLKEVALPIDEEYDWDLVASTLNKRHNASEYRSLWKVYLHPDINKNVWSKSENALLHEIAKKHEFQDWAAIAKELNTGRSGYQCFVYYRTNISNTCTGKKWTKEEEEYLRRLILYYKEDDYIPWGKVASAMENRTKVQIYNKYFRLVEKRKGRFIPEEDAVILACIEKFGLNFKKMAEYLPGRSASQIRLRYGVLGRKRTSAVWTIEEDRVLLQTITNEDKDINFSTVSKLFPGKTRTQTRTRYLTLLKWMKTHPNSSVENAPRRAARCLSQGPPTENLNKAIENLKKVIKMEVETSNVKSSVTVDSPIEDIEDAIMNYLTTEHFKEEEVQSAEMGSEQEEVDLNDVVIPAQSFNITNLQNLIIFLKGNLNQDHFAKSSFAEEHPELLKSTPKVKGLQIKSYSRKLAKTAVKVDETLDIWGDHNWGPSTCVLPPNNATIAACIRLVTYIRSMEKKACGALPLNMNLLMRFNPELKSVMLLLIERFSALFMYPFLLYHLDPEQIGKMLPKENISKSVACSKMPERDITESGDSETTVNRHGFLVPQIPKVQAETGNYTTTIDLEEPNAEQKKETCLPNIVMGEK